MTPLEAALSESLGHTILTLELAAGVVVGCVFMTLYAIRAGSLVWTDRIGRLVMANAFALTAGFVAGLLYRLGMQQAALALLLPVTTGVLAVKVWWVWQLLTADRD